jgi:hypothetical protein
MLALVMVALILGFTGPVAAGDSPTGAADQAAVRPPRIVLFEGMAPTSARVLDVHGRELPLTGAGTRVAADGVEVFVPRLPPGRFVVEAGGQRRVLEISGVGGLMLEPPEPPARPVAALALVVSLVAAGAAAAWVLRGHRARSGAVVALTAVAAAAVLMSFGSGPERFPGDPCLVEPPDVGTAYQCLSRHVSGVYFAEGTSAAVAELDRIAASGVPEWQSTCHEVAHLLGEISWKAGQDSRELVRAGSVNCSFGYFHGILEAMGSYLPDDEVAGEAGRLCQLAVQHFGPQSTSECSHGVGHAAMWRTNGDLPRAYRICDESGVSLEECRSGAAMEWTLVKENAAGDPRQLPEPRVASALELCRPPWGTPTPMCAEAAVFGMGVLDDLTGVVELCREMEPGDARACAGLVANQSVILRAPAGTQFLSPAELSAVCDLLADIDGGSCMRNIAYGLLFTVRDLSYVEEFCTQVGDRLNACLEGIEQVRRYVERTGDTSFPDLG